MAIKYVADDTTPLYKESTGSGRIVDLLWGDRVTVLSSSGSRSKVKARGKTGYVDTSALGDESLLEIYFIDVGQGDGILIRTPDHRHIMIDGGFNRAKQPSGKNAADFVDWKFVKDYGETNIHLDVMMSSHNDADHYGGLWDLLDVASAAELDAAAAVFLVKGCELENGLGSGSTNGGVFSPFVSPSLVLGGVKAEATARQTGRKSGAPVTR